MIYLTFKHWSQKIQTLRRAFKELSFSHISRSFNEVVDTLSKEAMSLNFGFVRIQEFMEGATTFEGVYDFKEFL